MPKPNENPRTLVCPNLSSSQQLLVYGPTGHLLAARPQPQTKAKKNHLIVRWSSSLLVISDRYDNFKNGF
jgi:hypothetical protein